MYPAGHILTAAILSKVAAKKLDLSFVKIMPVLILTNLIDLDHLIYYYLDDGTANSLVLHPAHIYTGFIIFLLFMVSLFRPNYRSFLYLLIGAFSMHMAVDALAFWFDYNLNLLVTLDLLLFLLLFGLKNRFDTSVPAKKLFLFLFVVYFVTGFVQYYMHFILKLNPQKEVIVYIIPNCIFFLAAVFFYIFFSKQIIKEKLRS